MNIKTELRRQPEQSRSQATLKLIQESAAYLFGEEGIDSVSMTQIAKRAGMSKPALYRYYKNKQALLRALAAESFSEIRASMLELFFEYRADNPAALLLKGIKKYCDAHCSEPYRIQLRAAINADPELCILDLQDSRENAEIIANFIKHNYQEVPNGNLGARALLMAEATNSLIRLVSIVDKQEADDLIKEFVDRFTADLTLKG